MKTHVSILSGEDHLLVAVIGRTFIATRLAMSGNREVHVIRYVFTKYT